MSAVTEPVTGHATETDHSVGHAPKGMDTALLGMLLFIASEVMFFGGLFAAYFNARATFPGEWRPPAGAHELEIFPLALPLTIILVASSFTMQFGVWAIRRGDQPAMRRWTAVTLLLGLVFLGLKLVEYLDHFHHGIYPGAYYQFADLPSMGANRFFSLYYCLTGLHALHVVAGLTALAVLMVLGARGHHTPQRHTALELGVLYWHLVDVIWIFVWPLMYLQK